MLKIGSNGFGLKTNYRKRKVMLLHCRSGGSVEVVRAIRDFLSEKKVVPRDEHFLLLTPLSSDRISVALWEKTKNLDLELCTIIRLTLIRVLFYFKKIKPKFKVPFTHPANS